MSCTHFPKTRSLYLLVQHTQSLPLSLVFFYFLGLNVNALSVSQWGTDKHGLEVDGHSMLLLLLLLCIFGCSQTSLPTCPNGASFSSPDDDEPE